MTKYKASFSIMVTIEFEDDTEHDLRDQAFEKAENLVDNDKVDEVRLLSMWELE